MTNATPCQCQSAGYCEHLGRQMPEAFHKLCATNLAYYQMFLGESRAGKYEAKPKVGTCAHKGGKIDARLCQFCGLKNVEFPVFACSVHGECSNNHRQHGLQACSFCDDYQETV